MDSMLAKACCESDAAWETYCRTPIQSTWELYVQAKRHEHQLEMQLEPKHVVTATARMKRKINQ